MSAAEGSGAVALFFVDRAAGHVGNQHANSAFVGPPVTSPKKIYQYGTRNITSAVF